MRDLKGHVDLVGLGHLFQLLSLNRCEGVITLVKGNERQSIYLGSEGMRLVSSTVPRVKRLDKLARRLLGPQAIRPQTLKTILRKEKLLGWTVGQVASSGG